MRGHIRKRGSTWAFVVYVGRKPDTGKPDYKWVSGFKTRKDAQQGLTEMLGRIDQGSYIEPTRQTVAEFLRDWLPALETRGLRETTRRSYKETVEQHLIPKLGSLPLQRLSAAHLNALYAELRVSGRCDGKGGLGPRSTRYCHTIIRRALADAVKWGLLQRNVADSADPPSAKAARARVMRTWSAEQLRAFLEHVKDDRLYAAWVLAATTGMRRGEVLGLPWRDVDLDTARLSVTQALVQGVGLTQPKTDKARRLVALDPSTVASLRNHQVVQATERELLGGSDHGLVFCQPDGSPLSPAGFTSMFDQRVEKSGLPRIRLHDLRHTHATLALQAGIHSKVVSERLGHSSVSITLDTYSHAIPALQETAADLVAALVFLA